METVEDFEDILELLARHEVRYAIKTRIDHPRHPEDARVLRRRSRR